MLIWLNVLEEPKIMLLIAVFLVEYGSGMLLLCTYLRPPPSPSQSIKSPGHVHQLVWTGLLNVASALACYFLV